MKTAIYLLAFLTLICYNNTQPENYTKESNAYESQKTESDDPKKIIQYSDKSLEEFLDSVGKLSPKPLINKVSFRSDSIFKNQLVIDKRMSIIDFNKLKEAIKAKEIDFKTATNIFGNLNLDSFYIGKKEIPIRLISFDKRSSDLNEYAICLGDPDINWRSDIYFLKSNILICRRTINHHYGLELKHYKDVDGKTIVYYKENYACGSGILWSNFYFYKYYDNKLIPILNELANANLQSPWGMRILWFESFVKKTNPLTLKIVYSQAFPDSNQATEDSDQAYQDSTEDQSFIDDSTTIQYTWDEKSKALIGNYEKTKINKKQIYSYYLEDNDLLFMNAYYKILKANLSNKEYRLATLNYLNFVKNYYIDN